MEHLTYEEGTKAIWRIANSLRGEMAPVDLYGLLLYALALHNNEDFRKCADLICPSDFSSDTFSDIVRSLPENSINTRALKALLPIFCNESSLSKESHALNRIFSGLRKLPDEWYKEFYSRLFDELTVQISAEAGYIAGFMQPVEITKLVAKLSGYDGRGSVYNPYAGSASYAIELGAKSAYYGEELNELAHAFGVMRLIAHGLNPEMLTIKDSFENWRGKSDISDEGEQFDYIIATPPFGTAINRGTEKAGAPHSSRRIDEDFLHRGALSLNDSGTLVGIFPTDITFRAGIISSLRKRLVESGIVSKVILLPGRIWRTTMAQTVIICLQKGKPTDRIMFVDARAFSKKEQRGSALLAEELLTAIEAEDTGCVKTVSPEDIARNGYSLFPLLYLKGNEEVPAGYVRLKAKDIVKRAPVRKEKDRETIGRVLELPDLSGNEYGTSVNPVSLKMTAIGKAENKMTLPFIALSRIGKLRPTMVDASESVPVYFSSSIAAVIATTQDVFIPLFLKEWERKAAGMELNSTGIIHLGIAFEAAVDLPAKKDEQKALFEKLVTEEKMAKVRELGLEELIASQKKDFIHILRHRKHDLNNNLCAVRNNVSALKKCILRTALADGTGLRDIKLAEHIDTTLGEQVTTLFSLLDSISDKVNHIADEESFGPEEKVNLTERLRKIRSYGNYQVALEIDKESISGENGAVPDVFVGINDADLDRVIENIVGNAVTHGFTDRQRQYILKICLSYDYTDDRYVVGFKNNGRPMPNGMDTLRYGIDGEKGTDSAGSGKGGAIVKNIVEHFGGCYEVINRPDDIFPVEILIKLPKYGDR